MHILTLEDIASFIQLALPQRTELVFVYQPMVCVLYAVQTVIGVNICNGMTTQHTLEMFHDDFNHTTAH